MTPWFLLRSEDEPLADGNPFPPPKEWQKKGIRAAMADASLAVRAEAIAICIEKHWLVSLVDGKDLLPLLKDSDLDVKLSAVGALGQMGKKAAPYAKALLPLLRDSNSSVKFNTAFTLGDIGKEAAPHLKYLLPLLKDSEIPVKNSAAYALGRMGNEAVPFVKDLLPLLRDPDGFVRTTAAEALGKIGKEAPSVLAKELLPLLDLKQAINASRWRKLRNLTT